MSAVKASDNLSNPEPNLRIFIAGATGVVGRRAVPLLVAAGHRVTAVARTPQKRVELERMGAAAVHVDLFAPDSLRSAVAGHDVVINLATSIPPSSRVFLPGAWRKNDRVRSTVPANLAAGALAGSAQRFIQESFAPVYPDCGERWIDESTRIRTERYSRTIEDAEAAAERFTRAGRVGVVLRFALFYGPGDAFTLATINLIRRGWMPILGSPDAFLSMVSHEDAATAVVAVLGMPTGIYNVVDDQPLRRREVAEAIAGMLGVRPPKFLPTWVVKLTGPLGETIARSLRISNRKLRQTSGWSSRYPSAREGWRVIVEATDRR